MENKPQPRRFLILDDDGDYRKLLVTFLRGVFPGTGIEEYDPVQSGIPGGDFDWSSYDVLILDYNLGRENATGLDILQSNRDTFDFPATVMLTGAGDEDIAVRAMKSGVHDYLRKEHLKKSHLRDSILEAFDHHRKERERLTALDSVRETAKKEAARLVAEYRARFEATRKEEEARLKAETARLEEELRKKQQKLMTLTTRMNSAEKARDAALREIRRLKDREKQAADGDDATRDGSIQTQLDEAHSELERLNNDLAETRQLQEHAEAELLKTNWRKEQEQTVQQQLQQDLSIFNIELEEQQENLEKMHARLRESRDIKIGVKSRHIEEERENDKKLLDEISGQLHRDDE